MFQDFVAAKIRLTLDYSSPSHRTTLMDIQTGLICFLVRSSEIFFPRIVELRQVDLKFSVHCIYVTHMLVTFLRKLHFLAHLHYIVTLYSFCLFVICIWAFSPFHLLCMLVAFLSVHVCHESIRLNLVQSQNVSFTCRNICQDIRIQMCMNHGNKNHFKEKLNISYLFA